MNEPISNKAYQAAYLTTDQANNLLNSYEGMYYVCELASSIFELLNKVLKSVPQPIIKAQQLVNGFLGISSSFDIVDNISKWLKPDKNAAVIWKNSKKKFGEKVVTSVESINSLVSFLNNIDLISFLKDNPTFTQYSNIVSIIVSVFGILNNSDKIEENKKIRIKATALFQEWKNRSNLNDATKLEIKNKITYWEQKTDVVITKKEKKVSEWTQLDHLFDNNPLAYQEYCQGKEKRWMVIQQNATNRFKRSCVAIAGNILAISLLVFSILFGQTFILTTLICTIVVSAFNVIQFVLDQIFKKNELPNLPNILQISNTTPL